MATYPGLQEYFGENGCYRLGYMGEQPTIDVYLRSVPAFELSNSGQLILPEPSKRSYPDIRFVIDDDTSNWAIVSFNAQSFGLTGVNEFLAELLQQDRDLTQLDELLPELQNLLRQPNSVWGHFSSDLDSKYTQGQLHNVWLEYHPGI